MKSAYKLYEWFDNKFSNNLVDASPAFTNSFVFASYNEIEFIIPTSPILFISNVKEVLSAFTLLKLNAPNVVNLFVISHSLCTSRPSIRSYAVTTPYSYVVDMIKLSKVIVLSPIFNSFFDNTSCPSER